MSLPDRSDFIAKTLELGRANLGKDPKTGIFQITTAQKLLASQLLDKDDPGFCEALRTSVRTVQFGFSDYGVVPTPEEQNDCILFAAAAGDLEAAKNIAAIETDYSNSHRFDITLNQLLKAILLGSPRLPSDYKATSSERDFFDSLSTIGTDHFSSEGIDRYWRATRHKRYSLTLFERRNLFSEGAIKIHEGI